MIDPAFREASGAEGSRSRGLQEQEAPSKRLNEMRLLEAPGGAGSMSRPQETPRGLRLQEAAQGGSRKPQETPRRLQETPGIGGVV
jgi:hypothetical protein